jgi:O-methyltransferase involved in polyketide biosynthesis
MTTTIPALTPVEDTLFLTLAGRALDHRSPRPILGDALADRIVRELDYDCGRFGLSASPIINIAHRAKKLDEVAAGFLAAHPDAVGLDLGAGLDTRVFRIDSPPTVDWYDVDLPGVVAARRQLIPRRPHAHDLTADLTDPHWLGGVPSDRPAVVVADGLMAFLADEEMRALLDRIVAHFPSGEIAFNGYTRFAVWAAKHYHGTQSVSGLMKSSGFDDPHEPERWNPRLTLVREILLTREPEVAQFPTVLRLWTQLCAQSTAVSRRGTTVLHYRF